MMPPFHRILATTAQCLAVGGGAALIQETLMSFRVFVFLLLLSSAKGMPPEQSDIAMRDRKIAMSEHNAAVEKAPEVTRLFGNVFA